MKDSSKNKGEPPETPVWSWENALKTAILCGLSVDEFDSITPYELALIIENHLEAKEADLKERLTLVWLGEYYHRSKRLPPLKQELKKVSSEKDRIMSDNEMLETVKLLNAQFGGIVVKPSEEGS